jgi:hypothetical protein
MAASPDQESKPCQGTYHQGSNESDFDHLRQGADQHRQSWEYQHQQRSTAADRCTRASQPNASQRHPKTREVHAIPRDDVLLVSSVGHTISVVTLV